MKPEHYRSAFSALAVLTATMCVGNAQPQPPDEVETPTLQVGVQQPVNHVVLHVQNAGAHIREGQLVSLIGPINPEGDYVVIPLSAPSSNPSRWIPAPYLTERLSERPEVHLLTNVRTQDSAQHQNESTHIVLMQILANGPNGPTNVRFITPRHQGSQGLHGGSAHLISN